MLRPTQNSLKNVYKFFNETITNLIMKENMKDTN